MSDYLDFTNLRFRYEPFPVGVAENIIPAEIYQQMLLCWPPTELFKVMPELGNKLALSEKFHSRNYHRFVASHPVWKGFHQWIKSDDFINHVMKALEANHIDLGYRQDVSGFKRISKAIKSALRGRPSHRGARLTARFEFQMMPATGGHIVPHTDTAAKIVTLVLSMPEPGEWDPAWGGGTDINRHRKPQYSFNWLNRQAPFEDMDIVDTYAYRPNQGVLFVKTFNSWHSVRPMLGNDQSAMRKSLIINITRPR